ncbi:MAG: hypothetical protein ACLFQX_11045 [Candidatus Kapaibacterium sp.]
MIITKQELLKLLDRFPEEIETEELIYIFYLRDKIRDAELDAEEGRIVDHDEVIREVELWKSE